MKAKLFALVLTVSMLFVSGCSCSANGIDPTTHYDENPEDFDPTVFISRHSDMELRLSNRVHKGGYTSDKNYRNHVDYVMDDSSGGRLIMAGGEFQIASDPTTGTRVYPYNEVITVFGSTEEFEALLKSNESNYTFTFTYDEANGTATVGYSRKGSDLVLALDKDLGQYYIASDGEISSYLQISYGTGDSILDIVKNNYGPNMIKPFLDYSIENGTFNKERLEFSYEPTEGAEPLYIEGELITHLLLRLRQEKNGEYVPDYFTYTSERDDDMVAGTRVDVVEITNFKYDDVKVDVSGLKPIKCDHKHKGYKYDSVDKDHHRKYCSYCGKYIGEPIAHTHHEGTGYCEKCLYNGGLIDLNNPDIRKLYPDVEDYHFYSDSNGKIFTLDYLSVYSEFEGAIDITNDSSHQSVTLLDDAATVWEKTSYVDLYYPEEKLLYVFIRNGEVYQYTDACLADQQCYLVKFTDVELAKTPEAAEGHEYDEALNQTIITSLPELAEQYTVGAKYLISKISISHKETHVVTSTEDCATIKETICDKCDEETNVNVKYNHEYEYELIDEDKLPNFVTPYYQENHVFFKRHCTACGLVDENIYELSTANLSKTHDIYTVYVRVHEPNGDSTYEYMTIPHLTHDGICTLCGVGHLDAGDLSVNIDKSAAEIHSLLAEGTVGYSISIGSSTISARNSKEGLYYYLVTSYVMLNEDEAGNRYVDAKICTYISETQSTDYINVKITDVTSENKLVVKVSHIEEDESEKLLGTLDMPYTLAEAA